MPDAPPPTGPACPVCATPWGPGPIPTVSCPHCGCALQARESRVPLNSLLIAGSLLTPTAALLLAPKTDEAMISIALVFAPLMALACGVILGLRISRSVTGKIGLACLLPILLCIGSELTLAAGCAWIKR